MPDSPGPAWYEPPDDDPIDREDEDTRGDRLYHERLEALIARRGREYDDYALANADDTHAGTPACNAGIPAETLHEEPTQEVPDGQ